ncbi:cyclase family protein [Acidisoma cellulosilytica]|uniref:Cyclase family protein n=1 Tax=Acidisoma cellulosilyticum TaxID=2802395 RepID=A0A964E4I4_9PROT|nr:cyclase family protein [Acidisoma cellulosilyticum]MCB8881519.1 cyclase family protein [Acidisoma cellulosilyticum]
MSADDNPALGEDWFPSRWGAEDQRGNGNLLSPAKVLEALTLARSGETIPLGFPYTPDMPFSPGRSFSLRLQGQSSGTGGPVGAKSRTIWNDDFVCTEIGQMGTHMDALGHLGHQAAGGCGHCETLLYNGNRLADVWSETGLKRLGIEHAPIFVARAVLLDIQGLKGEPLPRGTEITTDDLIFCLRRQGLPTEGWLRPGDVVLIRTGHGSRFYTEAVTWYDSSPGIGLPAAQYLSAFQPSVIGADNFAIEVMPPADPDYVLPCHQHLIMRHGIYLHEGMALDALAERSVSEFVYVFSPLSIVGATGSPGMPFAIL